MFVVVLLFVLVHDCLLCFIFFYCCPSLYLSYFPCSAHSHHTLTGADTSEVNSIVESIANSTRDFLRPFIIRESSVDELCRVVAALSEDVRSQMLGKILILCF